MKVKMPKTLGECADLLYGLREKRHKIQHEIDAIAKLEFAVREHLIEKLPVSQATGIAGKKVLAKVVVAEVPTVKDWNALWKWAFKTKSLDVLGWTISKEAIRSRWENKVKVPGVEKFLSKSISLTKV